MKVNKQVNPHFENFIFDWESKIYLLVGGYGSSKSYHIALKIILKLLGEKRTCLVVREVYDTYKFVGLDFGFEKCDSAEPKAIRYLQKCG